MSTPINPLQPTDPSQTTSNQDASALATQTMMNNLQTLMEALNDPTSSKDEKAKLVDAILKNMEATLQGNKGAFSPSIASGIQSCIAMAPQYVQNCDLPDLLQQTLGKLQQS
ncbi:MAG: hypothetical protein FJZ63_02580 [Chlamydiae bacterium]|nr:hypothetical protein [Chlamydiota bacterium]